MPVPSHPSHYVSPSAPGARNPPPAPATPVRGAVAQAGHVAFLVRLKGDPPADSLADVAKFYILLSDAGRGGGKHRLLRKKLPCSRSPGGAAELNLAFVEATGDHLCDVLTPTLVGRTLYLVGMGEYAVCSSGVRACRFAYRLLTPITAGPAQVMLGLAAQGVVGMSVKNPAHPGAPGVGLGAGERARFPPALAERAFGGLSGGYSWAPASVNGGALLDFAGAEVLLVGGDAGPPPPGAEAAFDVLRGVAADQGVTLVTAAARETGALGAYLV